MSNLNFYEHTKMMSMFSNYKQLDVLLHKYCEEKYNHHMHFTIDIQDEFKFKICLYGLGGVSEIKIIQMQDFEVFFKKKLGEINEL